MRIRLYFDEDAMDSDLVRALRTRGVEVVTAYEVGLIALPDEKHLSWATEQGRVIYSFNVNDLMALHVSYSVRGKGPRRNSSGTAAALCGRRTDAPLRLVEMKPAEAMRNTVEFLSNWG